MKLSKSTSEDHQKYLLSSLDDFSSPRIRPRSRGRRPNSRNASRRDCFVKSKKASSRSFACFFKVSFQVFSRLFRGCSLRFNGVVSGFLNVFQCCPMVFQWFVQGFSMFSPCLSSINASPHMNTQPPAEKSQLRTTCWSFPSQISFSKKV